MVRIFATVPIRLVALLAGLLFGFITWSGSPALAAPLPAPAKISVAASILPLADFCQHIGGDQVTITVLVPPGASPQTLRLYPHRCGQSRDG